MNLDDQLWILSSSLPEFVDDAFEQVRRDHPLLNRVPHINGRARWLEIAADVRTDHSEIARYEVPRIGLTSRFTLPPSMDRDRLVGWAADLVRHIAEIYRRDAYRRLYRIEGKLLGLDGLAPRAVGKNVVGDISEATMPGWRSRTMGARGNSAQRARTTVRESLMKFSSVTRKVRERGLVIVGERVFREIYGDAKFFIVSLGDPRLVAFNRGLLYRDPYCHPDEAFVVPTADIRFYTTPPTIQLARVPDASLAAVFISSGEQSIAQRRYGLGRMVAADM